MGFAEQVVRQYEYEQPGCRLAHFVGSTGTTRVALFSSINPHAPESSPTFQVITAPKTDDGQIHTLATYTAESRIWRPDGIMLTPDGGNYHMFVPFDRYASGVRRWPSIAEEIVVPAADTIVRLVELPATEHALAAVLLAEGFRPGGAPV
jgi:hypothetical protein